MSTLTRRRGVAVVISGLLTVALLSCFTSLALAMPPVWSVGVASGVVLAAMMLFLAAYHLRKKLPYSPLVQSSTWLQLHIYVGLVSLPVFLFHTGLRWPSGIFETALWWLYVLAFVSGAAGLVLTRMAPRRLAARGEEVIYERIAVFNRQLVEAVEKIALRSVEESGHTTLADFYREHLESYFCKVRWNWRMLFGSNRTRAALIGRLEAHQRYLSEPERACSQELIELIEKKDGLDFHYTLQGTLKLWLFVHLPLAWVLMMFLVAHVILVLAFSGGLA